MEPAISQRESSRAAGSEHDRGVHELIANGGAAHDNYKTRYRLIAEEAARFAAEQQRFSDTTKALEKERTEAAPRAHAEIEAKIKELKRQHGLEELQADDGRFATGQFKIKA